MSIARESTTLTGGAGLQQFVEAVPKSASVQTGPLHVPLLSSIDPLVQLRVLSDGHSAAVAQHRVYDAPKSLSVHSAKLQKPSGSRTASPLQVRVVSTLQGVEQQRVAPSPKSAGVHEAPAQEASFQFTAGA